LKLFGLGWYNYLRERYVHGGRRQRGTRHLLSLTLAE